jgi:hypothetical protein
MGLTINATKDFTCDLCAGTSNGEAETVAAPAGWIHYSRHSDNTEIYICDTCQGKASDADKATVYDALFSV